MSIESVSRQPLTALEEGNVVNGPAPAPPPRATQQSNEVGSANAQTLSPNSSGPTDGARASTEPAKAGWQLVNEEVEARLNADSEYVEAKSKYDTYKGMADDFALVDKACWFGPGDGLLGLADIQSVAGDEGQPEAVRAAARRLIQNMSVFNEAAAGNTQLTMSEVTEFVKGLKADVSSRKSSMTEKVEAEHSQQRGAASSNSRSGATSSPAQAGTAAGADPKVAAANNEVRAEMDRANPKPAPSEYDGLEGATENMNNMIGWGEGEIDRLTELMGKTDDPATLKQLENKINQMTRRMQQMTALMNQLSTALQNISKMYSDIAMNAVRNMR